MENLDNGMIELLPILPTLPTTQELINQAQSEMLDVSSKIRKMDYLTHKEADGEDMSKYGDWRGERKRLRVRYNELEAEVVKLKIKLAEENESNLLAKN